MEEVRGLQWTPKEKGRKEKIMWSAMNLSIENGSRWITRKTHPEFGSSRRLISKSVRLSTLMPKKQKCRGMFMQNRKENRGKRHK